MERFQGGRWLALFEIRRTKKKKKFLTKQSAKLSSDILG
jgi:hypothetical protein